MQSSLNDFDLIADKYDSSIPVHVVGHYLEKRAAFIKKFSGGRSILDVGCGTGMLAARLEVEGFSVTGLDPSEKMLEIAKKRIQGRVILGSSESLPFGGNEFDAVISIATFHHIADRDKISRTIKEMVRVVKKGGAIIIWDHNPLNPYWPVIMKKVPQDTGKERLIPANEIKECFLKSGVSRIRIFKKGFVPEFIPEQMLPLFRLLESILERTPVAGNFLLAHNVVLAYK